MSPGTYLRLRRQAAHLSIESVARACTSSPVSLPAAIAAIELAESDRELLTHADLTRLAGLFRFAPAVYLRLADGVAISVCTGCGCTLVRRLRRRLRLGGSRPNPMHRVLSAEGGMNERTVIALLRTDDELSQIGAGALGVTDAIASMIYELDERASDLLAAEQGDDLDLGDAEAPDFAIVDGAGRALVGAVLEREPDTNCFVIRLLTQKETDRAVGDAIRAEWLAEEEA